MKKIVSVALCALTLLALAACQRPEDRVKAVAETFLHAYYTADYAAAAEHCTPRLATLVSLGTDAQATLPADLAEKMKEAVALTSFKIVSVDVDEEASSARVVYLPTVPELDQPVEKALTLQMEGGTALVDRIE